LTQFLTDRKHGQLPEALGHGFYGSVAIRSSQKQYKNYPNIQGQTKGAGGDHTIAPPPLNTPLTDYRSILYCINSAAYAELSVFFRLISLSGHMGQLRGFSSAFLLVINRLSATWRHYTIVLVSFSELMKLSIFSASEK